ncbi:acetyl-CoA hydrolase/transferase family protein [Cladochytrium replicatum]|nr:acetyl-CoA hydrolase/transferase family protein [Cladochytrium replicatum]
MIFSSLRSADALRKTVSVASRIPLNTPSRSLLTRKGPPKVVSAEEAVKAVQSFSRVYVQGASAVPSTLLKALEQRHTELEGVEICHLHLEHPNPCSKPEYSKSFFANNFFIGGNQRKPVEEGIASYIPVFLHEVPRLMREGYVTPDVAFLNMSPPDKHGYCSLGTEICAAYPAAQTAKTIIAQINPNMPRTHGTSFIHWDSIDYAVHVKDPIPEAHPSEPNEVETKIGKIIAGLVSDGACLQMGIGNIPNAVLAELKHHKNLGIHTEMFAEGAIDLMELGVITNDAKHFLPGKTVTAFVVGTKRLYDFIDDNPSVAFYDASVTNNPSIIGSNPKTTSINAAIEVDITGQVCADSVGTRMISGVGGQVDFERGAALSPGGLPIICLPSTTPKGDSRIVAMLRPGSGVITTRHHSHYIITEWGHAYLFGKNLIQRAKALIDIAHPKHRAELERLAFERYKIKSWDYYV